LDSFFLPWIQKRDLIFRTAKENANSKPS
jgi:hypothetical protein